MNDEVFNKLLDIFNGRTGNEFSADELKIIEKEGEQRYKRSIPPGYKDNAKDINKYGDLIIWKELLSFSKEKSVDVIFVTEDKKEDWWFIDHGKTIGPRVELRKEFSKETGRKFHMYTMDRFLSIVAEKLKETVDTDTIAEVKSLSSNTQIPNVLSNDSFYVLSEREQSEVDAINRKIGIINNKHRKRESTIIRLLKKKKNDSLTNSEEIELKNCMHYNYMDEILIEQLNGKIDEIYKTNYEYKEILKKMKYK